MKALVIVDAQYDFMPGGALEVKDGDKIIPVINSLLPKFDLVVFTKDWHPSDHKSFASQHKNKNVFDKINLNGLEQVLWPDHCIQGTRGSDIHDDIDLSLIKGDFYIFKKGMDKEIDSYSGFYDNGRKKSTGLSEFLTEKGVDTVVITGLTLDFCAGFTAVDSVIEGFKTVVIKDATRPINENIEETLEKFYIEKIDLIESWELPLYNLL